MSKMGFLVFGSAFMFITTIAVDSMEGMNSSGNIIGSLPDEGSGSLSQVLSMLGTFFNMMTFNVSGVPAFFSIIFWIIAIGMIYIILNILKDVIPFT